MMHTYFFPDHMKTPEICLEAAKRGGLELVPEHMITKKMCVEAVIFSSDDESYECECGNCECERNECECDIFECDKCSNEKSFMMRLTNKQFIYFFPKTRCTLKH